MVETIMVLHKDIDTRLCIKILLEKNGYKVIEVISYTDFLSKIGKQKLDLILIDGLMPRKKIIEKASKFEVKVAYFNSDRLDGKELKLFKNVVGSIDEPRNIKLFLQKIKLLLQK